VHFDASGEERIVDLAQVYFELTKRYPLMHHFARKEDPELRRYDHMTSPTGESRAPKLKSDYSENFYRDAVESKELPKLDMGGKEAFLKRKAELARQAREDANKSQLLAGREAQEKADAASADEEAAWQRSVDEQVARRQEARRQRTLLLRGGKVPATLTKAKADDQELKEITTKRYEEVDLKDFVKPRMVAVEEGPSEVPTGTIVGVEAPPEREI